MALVVDLDAGQPQVAQLRERRLGEHRPRRPRPRVRDHGDAAGRDDQRHHVLEVGGVAAGVPRPTGVEVPLERLGAVGDHAAGDQRVGHVRSAGRRRAGRDAPYVVLGELDPCRAQVGQDRGHPGVAAREHPVQGEDQVRVLGVGQVRQEVHAGVLEAGADLDPGHQVEAERLGRLGRLGPALRRVVVGQRDHVEARLGGRPHHLRRALRAVGGARVGVEVDTHPHTRLTRRGAALRTASRPGAGRPEETSRRIQSSRSSSIAEAGRSTSHSHRPLASPAKTERSKRSSDDAVDTAHRDTDWLPIRTRAVG